MATVNTKFDKGHKPWNKGKVGVQVSTRKGLKLKPLSEEHKVKISLGLKGRIVSEETRLKIIKSNTGQTRTDETRKKQSLARQGKYQKENHPNWIADRTQLAKRQVRNDYATFDWIRQVRKRDGNKCRLRNENCSGILTVHHILDWVNYPQERHNINNGITLCLGHHPRGRAKEKELAPILQELLKEEAHG